MTKAAEPVSVSILDREYTVASPPEEQDKLKEAAAYLDKQMREIRRGGRVLGVERIAVMAALNMSYELLNADTIKSGNDDEVAERLDKIAKRIDAALQQSEQIELSA